MPFKSISENEFEETLRDTPVLRAGWEKVKSTLS